MYILFNYLIKNVCVSVLPAELGVGRVGAHDEGPEVHGTLLLAHVADTTHTPTTQC